MEAKMALTQRDVDRDYSRAKFKGGQLFVRDDNVKGLALRVTVNGAKSFILEWSKDNKSHRKTLGQYPVMSLPQARADALRKKGEIARDGAPALDRPAHTALTVGELCERYIRDHAKPHKRAWRRDEWRVETYLSRLARRPLEELTVGEVVALHQSINDEHGPVQANRVAQLLRSIFNKGQEWELTTRNPVRLKMFKEQKRRRFLSPAELLRVNEALIKEKDWRWRTYFPMLLLLGLRKSELLAARWTDVDEAARTITIPQTKTGEAHILPLPAAALDILAALPSRGKSEWIFPSERRASAHIVDPGGAWRRIRDDAGVPDVRVHDLRRTFASWLANGGFSLPLIGRALNHSSPSSTAIYARLQLDPVRAAMEQNAVAMFSKPAV
jgi:integrase